MERVQIKGEMLRWARDRSGLDSDDFSKRFPHFDAWESGTRFPTLKQLQGFAKGTYTPLGFLFLSEPPEESIPIPDLRLGPEGDPGRPSAHLLETIYRCQQRQDWFRSHSIATNELSISFIGSASTTSDVTTTASQMRESIHFDVTDRSSAPNWSHALTTFRNQVEQSGVLIMANGVVGNNTHRKLDRKEFKGFALADRYAPVIFVNSSDYKAAQIFTIAHELAHLWIGESGVSDADARTIVHGGVEGWCNSVAAEFLVPTQELQRLHDSHAPLDPELGRLANHFKVSSLVVLRSIRDLTGMSDQEYWRAYDRQLERVTAPVEGSGGNFHRTLSVRVGQRFARALIASTLEGETTFTEALRLLDLKKLETFYSYAAHLGFNV